MCAGASLGTGSSEDLLSPSAGGWQSQAGDKRAVPCLTLDLQRPVGT